MPETLTVNLGIARHKVIFGFAVVLGLISALLIWSAYTFVRPLMPEAQEVARLWIPAKSEILPITSYQSSGETIGIVLEVFKERTRDQMVSIYYPDEYRKGAVTNPPADRFGNHSSSQVNYVLHEGDRTFVALQEVPLDPIEGWKSETRLDGIRFVRAATTWIFPDKIIWQWTGGVVLGFVTLILVITIFIFRNTSWDDI